MIGPLGAWIRRHARMLALAGASAAAFGLLAFVSYQLALARVPEHRAVLERFVKAQSGFDVRFATLELGLGWHGPEARFTRIEMREPGRHAVVVRAPRLTVAFDTWRILRNGQLQAARVTLADAEIDLAPFLVTRRDVLDGAGADTARGDPLRLLERLPLLRIEVDGGTLRLPAANRGGLPHALRISRASLHRADAATSANALVLLPPHLGRSLFVALRLDGPLAGARSSATLRINGRNLAFAAWSGVLLTPWLPAAGHGDVSGTLEWRNGGLQRLESAVDLRDFAWSRRPDTSVLFRFPRARATVTASRRAAAVEWHVTGIRLDAGRGQIDAAALDLVVGEGGQRISGESSRLPLGALAGLVQAAGLGPLRWLGGLRATGGIEDLNFTWNARALPGERLRARAALEDFELVLLQQPASVAGLTASIEATDTRVRIRASGGNARVALPALFATIPEPLGIDAELLWSREPNGWSLVSRKLDVGHPAISMTLETELRGTDDGPASLVLRGRLNPVDVASWRGQVTLGDRWPTLAALAAAAGSGRLEGGELVLTGEVDPDLQGFETGAFAGHIAAQALEIAAGPHWPEATGVTGELLWGGGDTRLELHAGRVAGLQLLGARGEWSAGAARPERLVVELQGPIERARAWLASQNDLRAEFADLTSLDLRGDARIALSFASARARPGIQSVQPAGRWDITVDVANGRLAFAGAVPALEKLRGTIAVGAGRLQAVRLGGEWLGGAATLQDAAARARESERQRLVAKGQANASSFYSALGLTLPQAPNAVDPMLPWAARLRHTSATARVPAAWHIEFDATLPTDAGELPAALAWAEEHRRTLGVRLKLPQEGPGELALEALGAARGTAVLERRAGQWHVARAALRFGAGEPTLPAEPRLVVSGEAERLDPWATLAAFRLLEPDSGMLPGSIDLVVQELLMGTRRLAPARMSGSFDAQVLRLVLAGRDVAGSVLWPRGASAPDPAELRFARLALPADPQVNGAVLELLAAAGDAVLAIDEFEWGARRFGRLTARASAAKDALELRDIRIGQGAFSGEGQGACVTLLRRCEWQLTFESGDFGAALQRLGFVTGVRGGRGTVVLDFASEPTSERTGWSALSGRVAAQLEDGTTQPTPDGASGTQLPFLAAPVAFLAASAGDVGFESLAGRYDLRNGEAVTSDLRIVTRTGQLDIAGRIDLAGRLYELDGTLTTGGRASALHRMREERSMSAALAAVRELVGADPEPRSHLALRGSWDAPIVTSTEAGR